MFNVPAVPFPTVSPVGADGAVPATFPEEAVEAVEVPRALVAVTVTV
jgi:hypothetical protein